MNPRSRRRAILAPSCLLLVCLCALVPDGILAAGTRASGIGRAAARPESGASARHSPSRRARAACGCPPRRSPGRGRGGRGPPRRLDPGHPAPGADHRSRSGGSRGNARALRPSDARPGGRVPDHPRLRFREEARFRPRGFRGLGRRARLGRAAGTDDGGGRRRRVGRRDPERRGRRHRTPNRTRDGTRPRPPAGAGIGRRALFPGSERGRDGGGDVERPGGFHGRRLAARRDCPAMGHRPGDRRDHEIRGADSERGNLRSLPPRRHGDGGVGQGCHGERERGEPGLPRLDLPRPHGERRDNLGEPARDPPAGQRADPDPRHHRLRGRGRNPRRLPRLGREPPSALAVPAIGRGALRQPWIQRQRHRPRLSQHPEEFGRIRHQQNRLQFHPRGARDGTQFRHQPQLGRDHELKLPGRPARLLPRRHGGRVGGQGHLRPRRHQQPPLRARDAAARGGDPVRAGRLPRHGGRHGARLRPAGQRRGLGAQRSREFPLDRRSQPRLPSRRRPRRTGREFGCPLHAGGGLPGDRLVQLLAAGQRRQQRSRLAPPRRRGDPRRDGPGEPHPPHARARRVAGLHPAGLGSRDRPEPGRPGPHRRFPGRQPLPHRPRPHRRRRNRCLRRAPQ